MKGTSLKRVQNAVKFFLPIKTNVVKQTRRIERIGKIFIKIILIQNNTHVSKTRI